MVLDLPAVKSVTLTVNTQRLTPQNNDARLHPMRVASEAGLVVNVEYEDGKSRDLTADARVNYTVDDACAEIVGLDAQPNAQPAVRILSDATCAWVTVSAKFLGFTDSVKVPVVGVLSMSVYFTGWPDTSHNRDQQIDTLGLVQCTIDKYHRATAQAEIALSAHGPGKKTFRVTYHGTTFESADTSVATIQTPRRIEATAPGRVTITATFGKTNASAALDVKTVDPDWDVTSLALETQLWRGGGFQTLSLIAGTSQSSKVKLSHRNNVILEDVFSTLDWVDVESVISFSSDDIGTISVDTTGQLTLYDNAGYPVNVTAQLQCKDSISHTLEVAANLKPAELDVDFGQARGLQFTQTSDVYGLPILAVGVRIQTPPGERLINFQVICDLSDSSVLSSGKVTVAGTDHHSSFADQFGGTIGTLNSPKSQFQLVANNLQSGKTGNVDVGTVTLRVVGSGVVLVTGNIVDLITFDARDVRTHIMNVDVVAGRGYASLSTAARRRGLLPALPDERSIRRSTPRRPAEAMPSRQLEEAASCTDACGTQRVWGDVSGDCRFSSADVLEMSYLATRMEDYLAQPQDEVLPNRLPNPLSDLCTWRQQQASRASHATLAAQGAVGTI